MNSSDIFLSHLDMSIICNFLEYQPIGVMLYFQFLTDNKTVFLSFIQCVQYLVRNDKICCPPLRHTI